MLWYYDFPPGELGIADGPRGISHVFLRDQNRCSGMEEKETPLLRLAAGQLQEYFAGVRREFDLPLAPAGTAFQRSVWAALREIPWGETRSYSEIASAIGHPRACRAVGQANHRNPILILIPCHRVIGRDGSLTGYGAGIGMKRSLLELEGIPIP